MIQLERGKRDREWENKRNRVWERERKSDMNFIIDLNFIIDMIV